jgi:hypothetical protein
MSTVTMNSICPFCGGEAVLGDSSYGLFVNCRNPSCKVNREDNTQTLRSLLPAGIQPDLLIGDTVLDRAEDQEAVRKLLYPDHATSPY